MEWVNAVIQGVLLGGLYALFAAGLSLIFGVMRVVNIAHGDLIVLAAFIGLLVTTNLGVSPLVATIFVVPVMAVFGYGLQRIVLNRTVNTNLLSPLLVTFGLSVIIQNGLLEIFTADPHKLSAGSIEIASMELFDGLSLGYLPVLIFIVAVLVIATLQWIFYHTSLGRAFRATSDDPDIAQLMGINRNHIFGLAMALAMVVVAIAGMFLAVRTSFDPFTGPSRLIFGFEAVIIGGLGNIWGTLLGGIIIGVSQNIGAQINPGWQLLAGHLVFLMVLAFKPKGLFPRIEG